MTMHFTPPEPRPQNPLDVAIAALRAAGHNVEPAPGFVPGLFHIDHGPELTVGQVISVAAQKGLLRSW